MDTQDIILSELRQLRADYNDHSRDTGERLATVEAHIHALCGNGQPGRIALIEREVKRNSQWRRWVAGISAGASFVVSALSWLIIEFIRR